MLFASETHRYAVVFKVATLPLVVLRRRHKILDLRVNQT